MLFIRHRTNSAWLFVDGRTNSHYQNTSYVALALPGQTTLFCFFEVKTPPKSTIWLHETKLLLFAGLHYFIN